MFLYSTELSRPDVRFLFVLQMSNKNNLPKEEGFILAQVRDGMLSMTRGGEGAESSPPRVAGACSS